MPVFVCQHTYKDNPLTAHTALQVPAANAQLPPQLYSSKLRRVALADLLARKLSSEANRASATAAGQASGWHGAKGGDVHVDMPGVCVGGGG